MAHKTPEQKYQGKKRELNLGLANNLFGAGVGVGAIKLAHDKAKTLDPKDMKFKAPAEQKVSRVGAALRRAKIPPKAAVAGAGAALVGGSLINAGMDAQSAYYFGRERAKLKKPEPKEGQPVKKSYTREGLVDIYSTTRRRDSGIGYNLNSRNLEEITKRTPRGDEREHARQRKVARNEILGYTGAGAAGIGGAGLVAGSFDPRAAKTIGEHFGEAAFQRSPAYMRRAGKAGKYMPKGKFWGGAGLLAAAPAAAVLNRKAAERGKQAWR